jgi:hypothetical protein
MEVDEEDDVEEDVAAAEDVADPPMAAPKVTPLRPRRASTLAADAVVGASTAAVDVASMAAELLATRAELRRAKTALRVSRRREMTLKAALEAARAWAAAQEAAAPVAQAQEMEATRVVVVRPIDGEAKPARPVGAVTAGAVVVVYASAPVAAAEPMPMATDDAPASPMPQGLVAADAEDVDMPCVAGAAANVTPRSAHRRKSMAARAMLAPGDLAAGADGSDVDNASLPLVLSFDQDAAGTDSIEPEAQQEAAVAAADAADPSPVAPASDAPAPAGVCRLDVAAGTALVGRRVVVWWPGDKAWYAGVVASFGPRNKKHTVAYDDGTKEAVSLAQEVVRDEEAHLAAGAPPPEGVQLDAEEEAQEEGATTKKAAKKAPIKKAPAAAKRGRKEVEAPAAEAPAQEAPVAKRATRARR